MRSSLSTPTRTAALVVGSLLLVSPLAAQSAPDKPVVSGSFLGDGKEGNIRHLVVQAREPFSDQAAIRLVFTEKDPAGSKKPDFDAGFKKLGSALVLSVHRDGGIFGCEVAHTALPKSPFSSIGEIKMVEFKVTETSVSGRVSTNGERDAFGQKWNVDLTFSAPLPKGAFAAPVESSSAKAKEEEQAPVATGPKPPVGTLPLPDSARNVEYKPAVGHILFQTDAPVSAVASEWSAKLKAQGWQDAGGGVTTKANAILKRKRDGAELTIMIQSAGTGASVKVFTQGLDWSDTPESTAAKPAPTAPGTAVPDVNQLIQDAMKQIPGGR